LLDAFERVRGGGHYGVRGGDGRRDLPRRFLAGARRRGVEEERGCAADIQEARDRRACPHDPDSRPGAEAVNAGGDDGVDSCARHEGRGAHVDDHEHVAVVNAPADGVLDS
jgi:hypothetical protein